MSTDGNVYFDREGRIITLEKWNELSNDLAYKVVKQEIVNDRYCVITGWRGFDPYQLPTDGKPRAIFECIIFQATGDEAKQAHRLPNVGGWWITEANIGLYVSDSSTEAEALERHARLVELVKALPEPN